MSGVDGGRWGPAGRPGHPASTHPVGRRARSGSGGAIGGNSWCGGSPVGCCLPPSPLFFSPAATGSKAEGQRGQPRVVHLGRAASPLPGLPPSEQGREGHPGARVSTLEGLLSQPGDIWVVCAANRIVPVRRWLRSRKARRRPPS